MLPSAPGIPPIDTTRRAGKIVGMLQKLIESAMRSAIQELVTPQFEAQALRIDRLEQKLEGQVQRLEQKIDSQGARLDQKIDALGARLDHRLDGVILSVTAQGERLDKRIDSLTERFDHRFAEFSSAQGRLIEEVSALKRDRESAGDLARRVGRLEDHLLARAG